MSGSCTIHCTASCFFDVMNHNFGIGCDQWLFAFWSWKIPRPSLKLLPPKIYFKKKTSRSSVKAAKRQDKKNEKKNWIALKDKARAFLYLIDSLSKYLTSSCNYTFNPRGNWIDAEKEEFPISLLLVDVLRATMQSSWQRSSSRWPYTRSKAFYWTFQASLWQESRF